MAVPLKTSREPNVINSSHREESVYRQADFDRRGVHFIHTHPVDPTSIASGTPYSMPLSSADLDYMFSKGAMKRISAFGSDGSYWSAEKTMSFAQFRRRAPSVYKAYSHYLETDDMPLAADPTGGFLMHHGMWGVLDSRGVVAYSYRLTPVHQSALASYPEHAALWRQYFEHAMDGTLDGKSFWSSLDPSTVPEWSVTEEQRAAVVSLLNRGVPSVREAIAAGRARGFYTSVDEA